MRLSEAQHQEMNILLQFNLSSMQEGIKVHSGADAELVAATQRLFDKGLITLHDGGYLTSLGLKAAEHAQALKQILSTETTAA
ncbi:TIGR02647 family protein [Oceanospirillum multiglobuliferum]|uniref:TIGR02647 family protein n=1 Tax=Oceanospirillum multiglobuliferum TaxID=64969 RepID=A0A1T4PFV2_9GAMM|nr:TIGR02647 family protein [Oceanospirillum multiglobuliferum]OPX55574.1 TIGR02647 family protein [Oceanospirillum multiglobuliferum]SJZ90251.1 TIGR02647 family protein [Oceanospirillum multiglobuliferum]